MTSNPIRFATLALALAPLLAPVAPTHAAASTPAITWTRCSPGVMDPMWIRIWGDRLQCGNLRAPLDYDDPSSREIDIGLVRVKASSPADRQGALFFHFGGPGISPLNLLADTAALYQTASPSHPVDGAKHLIAAQFDLVAVVPRGLPGSTTYSCPRPLGLPGWFDTTAFLADWNWAGFLRDTRAFAEGCSADDTQRTMGTYEHVRDMERARVAMGEPFMHFFGVSYGTHVGATYAATFPQYTGRFVLDSVANYTTTFEAQLGVHAPARHGLFKKMALEPALANAAYGLGSDADAVMARIARMPGRLQGPWRPRMDTPAKLAAGLVLSDWVRAEMATWTDAEAWETLGERLVPRALRHRFSADSAIDAAIRAEAVRFASRLGPAGRQPSDLSMYYATVCGDTPWGRTTNDLRAMANTIAADFPMSGGAPVTVGLVCHHWRTPSRPLYSFANLAYARPMLMVQAEFDPATPFEGAINAFDATPRAHMVVARGMQGHGVFAMSATPCVERSVGRFLLTGELPEESLTYCHFEPAPPSRVTREPHEAPTAQELRERLREALFDS